MFESADLEHKVSKEEYKREEPKLREALLNAQFDLGAQKKFPRILSGIGVVVPLLLISYLTFRTSVARVEDANRHLKEMNRLYLSTVETLAIAIDAKDQVTSHHIRRVQNYALSLARAVGVNGDRDLKAIEAAALLHDTGKLSVPEFILNKPGKLTPAEFERIKLHTTAGARILSQIDFPYPVVPIVRHHHENWDGTGYPDGIKGEEIPLGARIMAVVDCYDALTSNRPYRPALSSDEALEIITERRGTVYDPRVVDAFLGVVGDFAFLDGHLAPPGGPPPWTAVPAPVTPDARYHAPLETRARPGDSRPDAEGILLLCSVAEGLAGRATLDDVAEAMSRHLRRMVPAPLVVFYLPDEAGAIIARHASGVGESRVAGLRIPIGSGLSGWVAANRMAIANSDPALDLGDCLASLSPPLESALSTPLLSGGALVGVLTLYAATRDAFSEDDRLIVDVAARQIASAVTHAVRFDEHRATMLRDRVTGLPNARSLEHLMASGSFVDTAPALSLGILCFVGGADGAAPLSVEQLVLQVTDATRSALRATDLVFRYSEDELVILMPETSPAIAGRVAQRVAASLLDGLSSAADLPVQIGMALAPADGVSIDDLLAAARGRLERQRWRDLAEAIPPSAVIGTGRAEA
jgi:putative nucleotidyltransferase with HDIG domain